MKVNKENWNKNDYQEFITYLFSINEKEYQIFQKKIIPNKKIIGIRTNKLKNIAKEIYLGNYKEFITHMKKIYYMV